MIQAVPEVHQKPEPSPVITVAPEPITPRAPAEVRIEARPPNPNFVSILTPQASVGIRQIPAVQKPENVQPREEPRSPTPSERAFPPVPSASGSPATERVFPPLGVSPTERGFPPIGPRVASLPQAQAEKAAQQGSCPQQVSHATVLSPTQPPQAGTLERSLSGGSNPSLERSHSGGTNVERAPSPPFPLPAVSPEKPVLTTERPMSPGSLTRSLERSITPPDQPPTGPLDRPALTSERPVSPVSLDRPGLGLTGAERSAHPPLERSITPPEQHQPTSVSPVSAPVTTTSASNGRPVRIAARPPITVRGKNAVNSQTLLPERFRPERTQSSSDLMDRSKYNTMPRSFVVTERPHTTDDVEPRKSLHNLFDNPPSTSPSNPTPIPTTPLSVVSPVKLQQHETEKQKASAAQPAAVLDAFVDSQINEMYLELQEAENENKSLSTPSTPQPTAPPTKSEAQIRAEARREAIAAARAQAQARAQHDFEARMKARIESRTNQSTPTHPPLGQGPLVPPPSQQQQKPGVGSGGTFSIDQMTNMNFQPVEPPPEEILPPEPEEAYFAKSLFDRNHHNQTTPNPRIQPNQYSSLPNRATPIRRQPVAQTMFADPDRN